MVSSETGENMPELRQAVYQAALELKETESTGKGDSLIGRKVISFRFISLDLILFDLISFEFLLFHFISYFF